MSRIHETPYVYAPTDWADNRQTTIIVGDFNVPHYKINGTTTKIFKKLEETLTMLSNIFIKLIFIEQYILLFSTVLKVQANAIGNNKRKGLKSRNKEVKLSLFTDNMIFYIENLKESTKKASETNKRW